MTVEEKKQKKADYDKKYRLLSYVREKDRDRWSRLTPQRRQEVIDRQMRRYEEKKEEILEKCRDYYQRNKHKWKEKGKLLHLSPEERTRRHREYSMRFKYGIGIDEYDAMLVSQGGVCAICSEPPKVGFNKRLHIDHDHVTGKIRGLICMHCNHSLERIESVENWAERATEYLKRTR